MKVELICRECGGKRFFNRKSNWKIGGEPEYTHTYECKKCHSWITLSYEKGLRKEKK